MARAKKLMVAILTGTRRSWQEVVARLAEDNTARLAEDGTARLTERF